jgi:hypothetical protein
LSRVSRWHSHGRGLSMRVLRDELNLRIDDFGEDAILNASIKQYHRLIRDYIARESLADIGVVHMVGCLTPLIHGR